MRSPLFFAQLLCVFYILNAYLLAILSIGPVNAVTVTLFALSIISIGTALATIVIHKYAKYLTLYWLIVYVAFLSVVIFIDGAVEWMSSRSIIGISPYFIPALLLAYIIPSSVIAFIARDKRESNVDIRKIAVESSRGYVIGIHRLLALAYTVVVISFMVMQYIYIHRVYGPSYFFLCINALIMLGFCMLFVLNNLLFYGKAVFYSLPICLAWQLLLLTIIIILHFIFNSFLSALFLSRFLIGEMLIVFVLSLISLIMHINSRRWSLGQ